MKETSFINQNKDKWARFEKISKEKSSDPDEISELFTEITEDLSYARTFYPRRSVRVYLNQLAQGVFTKLYKQKKQPISGFAKFWVETVPIELYRIRKSMLTAIIFFGLAVLLGAVSQHFDQDFIRLIVGDGYVNATEDRIANGDPMGVYGTQGETSMFFAITINNIRVAFITFVLGIFASLGSMLLLLHNGIMLGSFQWWFKAKGLLLTSFLAIWIHGAFEISAIVIAGGAGIAVGQGLLFPGTYTRLQSLIYSAKRGLVVLMSLVPVFITAGFLESFVTRHYLSMPNILKAAIIFGSFALIILYYGIYPFIVARSHPDKIEVREVPRYVPERKIELYKIRNTGEIFSDSISFLINHLTKISKLIFKTAIPIGLIIIAITAILKFSYLDYSFRSNKILSYFLSTGEKRDVFTFFLWPLYLSLIILSSSFIFKRYFFKDEMKSNSFVKFSLKPFLSIYLFSFILYTLFNFIPNWFLFFLFIPLSPILSRVPAQVIFAGDNVFSAFGKSFQFEKGSYGEGIGNSLIFFIINYIFFYILQNPFDLGVLELIDGFLRDTLIIGVDRYQLVINIFNFVIYLLFFTFALTISFISFTFYYFSDQEKKTANGLFKKLLVFGKINAFYETKQDFE